MEIINKFISFMAVLLGSCFFLLGVTTLVSAEDCVQKRTTLLAPENIYKLGNPLGSTPDNVSAGEKLYHKEAKPLACVQCHGPKGKADGVMAKGMTPKPRDFSCSAMMKDIPDGQLFWVIKNGSKGTGMMSFNALNDTQIWQVVSYIRKLSN
ncbi:MAG: mono/diheme cytochrome c family protein [Nitrospinales bacterium]|jgi:mono/diheme cytochrome c family protein